MSYFDSLNGDVMFEISKYLNLINIINLYQVINYKISKNILNQIVDELINKAGLYCGICFSSCNNFLDKCNKCNVHMCNNCSRNCYHISNLSDRTKCIDLRACTARICKKCLIEDNICKGCDGYICNRHKQK